ncbi:MULTISPECIES: Ig-like domain-containing protein [unclassified Streptomyces]|uniref:L,D-transpeptidase n=2 Tax=unclassified Streptomyces TaxID=2593676 RepID=UPI00202EB23A|nr:MULTISPECIES: Ig-like domain-containing protein [unclassified Streptomyces]MCM1969578.1 Ig-like domain-containing protein [Streptomyces sp. G1]MCX5128598.1 Ig-like domain-containing protein [Streptomyces sp. NBC_00347]
MAGAVVGVVFVVAAAPQTASRSGDGPQAGGAPAGSVELLVGRVLDDGGRRCSMDAFRAGLCGGLEEQLVRATASGAGSVVRDPSSRGAARAAAHTVVLPTDAAGPLEIALAGPGLLTYVTVHDGHGRYVAGALGARGHHWSNTEPLRAGETYTVRVGAQDAAGTPVGVTMAFRTAATAQDDRLTAEFGPRPGTYGAGQIVTASLSRPVPATDPAARARLERALQVTSEPAVEGAWHWVDDSTLHYRPRTYWPAHAVVHVVSGLDGVEVGERQYGGPSESLRFTIGDRIEAVTDAAAHEMTVRRNGRTVRTIPVTTGKAGFLTRSGIKVVLGKERKVRMRGDTVGIKRGTSEFYDLPVFYATRVTWSGEYVHAAPWSVDAQGEENVSHGCTGMSTADAAWFFDTVREGDVVSVVNSGGEPMAPFANGFGDWNLDWDAWLAGSALGAATDAPLASASALASAHGPSRLVPLT